MNDTIKSAIRALAVAVLLAAIGAGVAGWQARGVLDLRPPANQVLYVYHAPADQASEATSVDDLPQDVYDAPYTCKPVLARTLSKAQVTYLVASGWTQDGTQLRAYGC